jgi:hypothetical protein
MSARIDRRIAGRGSRRKLFKSFTTTWSSTTWISFVVNAPVFPRSLETTNRTDASSTLRRKMMPVENPAESLAVLTIAKLGDALDIWAGE